MHETVIWSVRASTYHSRCDNQFARRHPLPASVAGRPRPCARNTNPSEKKDRVLKWRRLDTRSECCQQRIAAMRSYQKIMRRTQPGFQWNAWYFLLSASWTPAHESSWACSAPAERQQITKWGEYFRQNVSNGCLLTNRFAFRILFAE